MFEFQLRFDAFTIFWFETLNFFEPILAYSCYAKNHSFLACHGPIF